MEVKKEATASGSDQARMELEAYVQTVNEPGFDPDRAAALLAQIAETDQAALNYNEAQALAQLPLVTEAPVRSSRKLLRVVKITIAALLLLAAIAGALGIDPLQLLREAKDTITFRQNPSGFLSLPEAPDTGYASLQESLDAHGITEPLCPTWIPGDYYVEQVSVRTSDETFRISAIYTAPRGGIRVEIAKNYKKDVVQKEEIKEGSYLYSSHGRDYYILINTETLKAYWEQAEYSCTISGQITKEEMELMINSIR